MCDNIDVDSSSNKSSWFFIVGTYDMSKELNHYTYPDSTRIYVNGEECASGRIREARTAAGTEARWAIGGFLDGTPKASGGWYAGYIDDARVFDRELSAEEIEALWESPANGGTPTPEP